MRMWHYRLIKFLPDKQLGGQWRELFTLVGNVKKFGKPNSSILNKMIEYDRDNLLAYASMVYTEGARRGKHFNWNDFVTRLNEIPDECFGSKHGETLYDDWMTDRYLRQCYYNLQEKFDGGTIPENVWDKIYRYIVDIFDVSY